MSDRSDTASVIAPPPLIALAALLVGLVLDWHFPTALLSNAAPRPARVAFGVILIVVGAALIVAANVSFRSAGTSPEPWKPSTALVDRGVFGWLRNPMYAGGTLLLFGLAIALGSDWLVLTTVASAAVLHFGVVRREERYLTGKFGDAYRGYCERVGRYGWPPRR